MALGGAHQQRDGCVLFLCSRAERSSTPRNQIPGGLVPSRHSFWDPSQRVSTWIRLAADSSVEGFPDNRYLCIMLTCLPRGGGEGALRCTQVVSQVWFRTQLLSTVKFTVPPHHPPAFSSQLPKDWVSLLTSETAANRNKRGGQSPFPPPMPIPTCPSLLNTRIFIPLLQILE